MKFRNVYKLFALLVLFVTLQSRSTGPGSTQNLEVTGAPGSTGDKGTCANTGCHVSGAFDPSISIKLLEAGNQVTQYQAGKTYTLQVSLTAGNGVPDRYGFQAVALDASDAQAGAWGTLGAGQHTVTLSSRSYAEHSAPSASNEFELEWVAPGAGSGAVTFYSAGNATNNNGSSAGDGEANSALVIEEETLNSVLTPNREKASLKVLPNPVQETLNLQIKSLVSGQYNIKIIDAMGRVASSTPTNVQLGQQIASVDVNDLTPGLYIVQLCGTGQHLAAVQMLKN